MLNICTFKYIRQRLTLHPQVSAVRQKTYVYRLDMHLFIIKQHNMDSQR